MTNKTQQEEWKLIQEFDNFIKKWCGKSVPHLLDNDENDGERFRILLTTTRKEAIEECVGVLELTKEICKTEKSETECWTRDYNKGIDKAIEKLNQLKARE